MSERRPRRRRLTYANVAATLALLLALSGIAYGAPGWITSRDIVNNTIKPVDMNATFWTAALPPAISGYKNDAGTVTGAGETVVGTIGVLPGSWFIIAKVVAVNEGGGTFLQCFLRSGPDWDATGDAIEASVATDNSESLAMTLAHTAAANEVVTVSCHPHGGTVHLYDLKVTAIQLGYLLNQPLP